MSLRKRWRMVCETALRVVSTLVPCVAEASKLRKRFGRLFSTCSMYSTEATLGRSRLLYCSTSGMRSMDWPFNRRLASSAAKASRFSRWRSIWESATKTMPSACFSTIWKLAR